MEPLTIPPQLLAAITEAQSAKAEAQTKASEAQAAMDAEAAAEAQRNRAVAVASDAKQRALDRAHVAINIFEELFLDKKPDTPPAPTDPTPPPDPAPVI